MALTDKDVSTFNDIGANISGFKAFGTDENGVAKGFQVAKFSDSVATSFDATRTSSDPYNVGDVVMYGGRLYRFTVEHYGAWNASHVSVESAEVAVKSVRALDNAEYVYAVVDSNDVFLFGVKKDGSVEWAKGIPEPVKIYVQGLIDGVGGDVSALAERMAAVESGKVDKVEGKSLINSVFADGVKVVQNDEYAYAVVDANDVFLFGVKTDGSFDWQKGPNKEVPFGKWFVDLVFSNTISSNDIGEFFSCLVDLSNKLIEAVDKNGKRIFFVPPRFENGVDWNEKTLSGLELSLREHGISFGTGDWSHETSLQIRKPNFAIVDFSGISGMPTTKTDDLDGVMRFWDMSGNFFKKNVVLNAQGDSSLSQPKKNIAVDLLNDDGESFSVKFGSWVSQDSFHLKAYYTDFFRGIAAVGYSLYKDIVNNRATLKNRTWKSAKIDSSKFSYGPGAGYGEPSEWDKRIDDGALCFPEGFPCAVFLNGEFYGIFVFQLKKHRDNYSMDKDNPLNIHLDGKLSNSTIWGGSVDWAEFEIRNPKNLYCIDGSEYDGDNPAEIVDSVTAESWISAGVLPDGTEITSKIAKRLRNTAVVKSKILELSSVYALIESKSTTADKKVVFEKYFDLDSMIDYQVFGDFVGNGDGFAKNWQVTTWDGEKWFFNPYDLDCIIGGNPSGDVFNLPNNNHLGFVGGGTPSSYVMQYYMTELRARWSKLRSNGILSVESVIGKLSEWMATVGLENYKKEFEKWSDCPCNRDIVINDDYWEIKLDSDGKPVISYSLEGKYNPLLTYDAGDECQLNPTLSYPDSHGWWYVFVCKAGCTGEKPCLKSGVRDSLSRVENWMKKQVENMDIV